MSERVFLELTEEADLRVPGFDLSPEEAAAVFALLDSERAKVKALREALEKVACCHIAWPEKNYPGYAAMAVVTARRALAPEPEEKG